MAETSQLGPGIRVHTSDFYQTNCVLLGGGAIRPRSGAAASAAPRALVVVDPGVTPEDLTAVRSLAVGASQVTVGFTHTDFDHVIGWRELSPRAVIAHPLAATRDPGPLRAEVAAFDARSGVARKVIWDYPPQALFESPQELTASDLAGLDLRLYPAPGHTGDSAFFVFPEQALLIAGDYLSDLFFPIIYASALAYRESLRLARSLMETYGVESLVPGHGAPARSAREMKARLHDDTAYIDELISLANGVLARGLTLEQTCALGMRMRFRGKRISDGLARNHEDNVRLAYAELKAARAAG